MRITMLLVGLSAAILSSTSAEAAGKPVCKQDKNRRVICSPARPTAAAVKSARIAARRAPVKLAHARPPSVRPPIVRPAPVRASMIRLPSPPMGKAMRDGGVTMPPAGWMAYCGRNPNDLSCKVVMLDEAHWKQLQEIKTGLDGIRESRDARSVAEGDVWEVATTSGDCEDIALAGREKLLAAGWPRSAVRLATAWTEEGDYHTVLTIDGVRDGKIETFVLDNRFARIEQWEKLARMGYRFQMRQAARGPNWVTIRG